MVDFCIILIYLKPAVVTIPELGNGIQVGEAPVFALAADLAEAVGSNSTRAMDFCVRTSEVNY